MEPRSPDITVRGQFHGTEATDLKDATMPNLEDSIARTIASVALDPGHPFASFAKQETLNIRNAFNRHGVGGIVTGLQTGTDSAAVAIAGELGIPLIGFAPRGYINEDGVLPAEIQKKALQPHGAFCLCDEATVLEQEKLPVARRDKIYAERTHLNAQYSSATLIINPGKLDGGTLFTVACVLRHHQPRKVFIIDPSREYERQVREARQWIERESPLLLNIAGPRQSSSQISGIDVFGESLKTLRDVLS